MIFMAVLLRKAQNKADSVKGPVFGICSCKALKVLMKSSKQRCARPTTERNAESA